MSGKSPLGNSREPQSYEGINVIVPIGGWQLIKSTGPFARNPTTNDKKYPIGSIWVNTATNSAFILTSAPGVWTGLAGSFTANSLTVNGPVSLADGGSPLLIGTTGGMYPGNLNNTAPAPGYIGEQNREAIASASAVTLTTNTPANVAALDLNPGIWDVSGIVNFTGITTGTIQTASINTVSATIGTQGDNAVSLNQTSTANADVSLTIPAWRVSVASPTPVLVYLVANATFTVGTAKAYGRISATRVA